MMVRHRSQAEVRRYNWFKIIVLVILVLLLLLLSLSRCNGPAAVSEISPTAVPEAIPIDNETAATVSTATSETAVALDTPQLTAPAEADPLPVNSEVELVGIGTPGSDVRILLNGQIEQTVRVGEDGTWRYTFTPEETGELEVSLEAVDEAGEVQAEPAVINFMVAAPEPEITAPTLDQPEEEVVAGDYTLTGSGTPGSTVEVVIDGQAVGTAEVNEDGTWSLVTELSEPGNYNVSIRALDAAGNVAAEAEAVELAVAQLIEAPTLDLPLSEDGITAGDVELSGTGTPGSSIVIEINGEEVETVEVDADGNWSYTADLAEAGDYQVVVRALDDSGEPVAEAEPVTISTAARPNLLAVIANEGEFNWLLTAFATLSPTVMITETLSAAGPYTLLAPTDAAFAALPTEASDALLGDEEALFRLLQHHVVEGRVDVATAAADGTLLTIAGDTITVTTAADDTVLLDGVEVLDPDIEADNGLLHILNGVLLPPVDVEPPIIDVSGVPTFEGPLLTIVGTAEPGTTLVITINGETFGTTTVEADGTWLVAGNIEDGEHIIVAYTLDDNGIPLIRSSPVILTSPAP